MLACLLAGSLNTASKSNIRKKSQGKRNDITSAQNDQKLETSKQLANAFGVSRATVERAGAAADIIETAEQASDESLLKMARRIQARAISRCGELLKQIEPVHGVRTDLEHRDGSDPMLTRKSAAQEAGLSKHQQKIDDGGDPNFLTRKIALPESRY